MIPLAMADAHLLDEWTELEERALEQNAYLSPAFVVPATRYLEPSGRKAQPLLLVAEDATAGHRRLLAAGVFTWSRGSRRFPLPHLQAYRSVHSFLSGILVDREQAGAVMCALFQWLGSQGPPVHGIEFVDRPADGSQAVLLDRSARECGAVWYERETSRRATLVPAEAGPAYLATRLDRRRLKNERRTRSLLEGFGTVRWQALRGPAVDDMCVERFLSLEHMGWKGRAGTSLRAQPRHEAFFREIVERFRVTQNIFFTELWLNDIAIAATCNLISGRAGFAFKIGWNPEYARMAPGLLNELEFIRHAPRFFGDLAYVDSGAAEASFIDELWAGRRLLTSGVFATSRLGQRVGRALAVLQKLKRGCLAMRK